MTPSIGDIVDFYEDESYHGSCLMVTAIDGNALVLASMDDDGHYDMESVYYVESQYLTKIHADTMPPFIK